MNTKTQSNSRNRFLKLSLKKNHENSAKAARKLNQSSDVIILDESFDRLQMEFKNNISPKKIYSPIMINDSCELFDEKLPKIELVKTKPSKTGNILNSTKEDMATPLNESRPSFDGWSPSQNIVCVTPKQETIPSTPKDIANESLEECSMKKIQQSQKKLLDDLYGDTWKSIPSLLKTLKKEKHNIVPKKLFDDDADNIISEKASTRKEIKQNKLLYLTESEKKINKELSTEKKFKKKLYTEVVPNTPEPKTKKKEKNTSTKKLKGLSVTELVQVMKNDVDNLTRKVENISVSKNVEITPSKELAVNRLSFLASLADNVPSWRCHPEAIQYRDNFKSLREQLTRRLFLDFNKIVFDNVLDADLPIIWDTKLRSTAGTTTNRLLKTARGDRIRTSSVKLSSKVVDAPQRLRDTLIHELCHAATWLLDGELRAGHGPLWKKWATRALKLLPELGEISRCHDMEIYFKYCYKCTKCGYSIKRHSKSIDVTKKCCGYCHGTFEVIVNRKNKDGVVVSTPARKTGPNGFALFVKENYGNLKDGTKSHAEVMKLLGEQFSARKKKIEEFDI
ncbi:PREDICTED: uncharacterized protein LOC106111305 [Papilio polytes]|uniref:uncharacterized protein LOC106111305 n=1 Tax=Papilio polytes TaxID=76194 RepID=UPI000676743E|nr:PREDICTED: uncharacterized protein LOC106111305 [Papilio polytes]